MKQRRTRRKAEYRNLSGSLGGVFLHRGWWQDGVEGTSAWTSKSNPGPNSDEKCEGNVDVTAVWSRHNVQTEGRWVLIGFLFTKCRVCGWG